MNSGSCPLYDINALDDGHFFSFIHYYSDVRYILPLASLAIVHSQYISAG